MNCNFKRLFILIFCSLLIISWSAGQVTTILGKVIDKETGESLIGVNVTIRDQLTGTITNANGSFSLITKVPRPFILVISMLGYQSQEFEIDDDRTELEIQMLEQIYLGQEVIISASKIRESIMKSPVSIEKISGLEIQQSSAANFYDGLYTLKGVDMNVHSLTFSYPSTRGFTGETNYRMSQIIDGVENVPPGLSFSAGNIFGLSELDVKSIELLIGASSALYGPGGMNGLLIMTSKDPYNFQGFSFSSQAGIMNVNGKQGSGPTPMGSINFRYAKSFNNKLAFKVKAGYLRATDWFANDLRDRNDLNNSHSNRKNNPGYDGVNVYGDDIIVPVNLKNVAPQVAAGVAEAQGLVPGTPEYDAEVQRIINLFPDQIVTRTGWTEKDMLNHMTENLRFGGSVHYRFLDKFEAMLQGDYAQGSSVYTAQNRFSLRNFSIYTLRAEIKNNDSYIRGYTTTDNSGDSYDAGGAALKLNEAWKPSEQWYEDYIQTFTQQLLMGNSEESAHQFARTVADNRDQNNNIFDPSRPALPLPGTEEFNDYLNPIIHTPVSDGGAEVIDRSRVYHVEGMYNFSRIVKWFELITGGSARIYQINSEGTVFFDSPGHPVKFMQYGAFLQAGKQLINEQLKITTSARYDKNDYFKGRITPRISVIYSFGTRLENNIRASVQTAFRFPSIADQMVDINVGPFIILGGLPEVQAQYDIPDIPVYPLTGGNPVTDKPVTENGPYEIPAFRPERVLALEVGYKALLIKKHLMIDAYLYSNQYNGFQATQVLVQNPYEENERRFQTTISTDQPITAYGWAFGADYRATHDFIFKGNISYDGLKELEEPLPGFQTKFNTPKFKLNLGVGNSHLTNKVGFNINWRWQEAFLWESTFGVAEIPASNTLDAHISYHMSRLKSVLKIGGSNLLNRYYTTSFGTAQVGGLYYLSLTFDELMN
jgi:outer membrane receptor protein involved in Fe transport